MTLEDKLLHKLAGAHQQQQAMTQNFIMTTSISLYAALVAQHDEVSYEDLRKIAKTAVTAAPFLAEAHGMIIMHEPGGNNDG